MHNYDEFEDAQKELEQKAEKDYEGMGVIITWLFLLVGVAITGAATHFLTGQATVHAPIYKQFIGSQNAAWLTVFILEGSLIGLLIGQQTFFKEHDQRWLAKIAQYVVWGVLAFNTLCAFVVWSKGWKELPKPLSLYCTWALPVLICGAILLWKELWTRRRKGKQQALALETSARANELWRRQYAANTEAYQKAVSKVSLSEEVQSLREALARRDVLKDLAKQHNVEEADIERLLSAQPKRRLFQPPTVDADYQEIEEPKRGYVNGATRNP